MGTRHLTAVYLDGKYRVAQYGQWDGYPDGAGVDVLRFAQRLSNPYVRNQFADKVRRCHFIETEEERRKVEQDIADYGDGWTKEWPWLSRDAGPEVLNMILNSEDGLALANQIDFAADGIFCEWVWVIDMDKGTFEGYEGFNKEPLTEGDRFYFLRDKEENGYHGAKLVKSYNIIDLPTKAEFLKDFGGGED